MEAEITITRSQMVRALADWDREAKDQGWTVRNDEDRHEDAADYLFHRLRQHGAG